MVNIFIQIQILIKKKILQKPKQQIDWLVAVGQR